MKDYIVALDLDGLMVDSERFYLKIMTKYNKQHNYFFPKTFYIDNCLGKNKQQITIELSRLWGKSFDFESYWKDLIALRIELLNTTVIRKKKGLMKLLKYLKLNNIKTVIVSSSSTIWIKKILSNSGISEKYFDKIFGGELVDRAKPYPDLYILTYKYYGINSNKMIAIEDSVSGIESAFSAGAKVICIPDILSLSEDIQKKTIISLNSLDEVITFLENF